METRTPDTITVTLSRVVRDDGTEASRLTWSFPEGRRLELDRVERVSGWPEWQRSGRAIGHIGFSRMLDGVFAFMTKELDAAEAQVEQSWLTEHDPKATLAILAERIVHVVRWRAATREVEFRKGGSTGSGWYRVGEAGAVIASSDEDRMLRDLGSFLSDGDDAFDADPGLLY